MHDDVIEAGGDVRIFSSMHVSGERKFEEFIMCKMQGIFK
jgi:hypothetical protein